MRTRVLAVLLVVVVAALAGTVRPDSAEAFSGPTPYESLRTNGTTSSYIGKFLNLLRGGSTAEGTAYGTLMGGETATTRTGIGTMMYRARVGARFLPVLGTVASRVTIYGTAAYLAWRIYQHYADGSTQTVDLWLDNASLGRDALFNPAGIPTDVAGANPGSSYYWAGAGLVKLTGSNCSGVGTTECFAVELSPAYCGGGVPSACNQYYTNADLTAQANGTLTPSATTYPSISTTSTHRNTRAWFEGVDWDYCRLYGIDTAWTCFGASNGSGTVATATGYMLWRTLQNLSDGRTIGGAQSVAVNRNVTVGTYSLPVRKVLVPAPDFGTGARVMDDPGGTTPALTTDHNVPAAATETDVGKALDQLDTPCGHALVNHIVLPSVFPWIPGCIEVAPTEDPAPQTLSLPRPQANETYTDYISRLQALGWVGAATLVELDPYDPDIGTEAVQKVGVTGKTGTWRRALWPATNPELGLSTNLTFWHNPASAPAVAPDPTDEQNPETDPGSGVVGNGECDPWLTAEPDFSPLTGLSFGNVFPFGLFAWAGDVIGQFNVTPTTPTWTFNFTMPATGVSDEIVFPPFTIDLSAANDYMSAIRTLLSFVMWFGAVWYFATALLGLRAGDPGEAVDEAV